MPAAFRFPDAATVFWEPLDVARRAASGDPSERRVSVVARLAPDLTFEQADARATALAPQWDPEWFPAGYTTRLRSLNGLAGLGVDGQFSAVQQGRGALFLLFGLGACMLLIACANSANLFLSQALEPRLSGTRYAAAESRSRFLTQLADLSAATPGVELAAPAEQVPFLTHRLSFGRLETDGASAAQAEVTINHVANRHFAAAGIPILEGRGFSEDVGGQDTALISRDLADRLWQPGAAVGQRFRMPRLAALNDGAWLTVVGVTGIVHTNASGFSFGSDLPEDPYEIYLPWTSRGGAWRQPRFVLARAAGGTDAIGLLKEQVWRLDPELPVTVHAMDDVVANALAQPRFLTTLLAALALLALLLAGAGLFAVVSYETSARTREIGVRVALGATRGGVIRHVLGRSLLQSAAGAAVGLLGAFALTRLLAVPLFGSEPTYPATFAVATAFLLLAAAGGAWLPARRAARTDPMAALRAE